MLTFGGSDPEDHPKSHSVALQIAITLQIAKEMNGSFSDACVVSSFLRNNLDKAHERRTLPLSSKCVNFVLYDRYQTSFPHDTIPEITLHDVVSRRAKPQGRFERHLHINHPYLRTIATLSVAQ